MTSVQVGVVGSYEALKQLIADYRADAAEVYFPFPRPLAGPPYWQYLHAKAGPGLRPWRPWTGSPTRILGAGD